jgi:hypothetical protein
MQWQIWLLKRLWLAGRQVVQVKKLLLKQGAVQVDPPRVHNLLDLRDLNCSFLVRAVAELVHRANRRSDVLNDQLVLHFVVLHHFGADGFWFAESLQDVIRVGSDELMDDGVKQHKQCEQVFAVLVHPFWRVGGSLAPGHVLWAKQATHLSDVPLQLDAQVLELEVLPLRVSC